MVSLKEALASSSNVESINGTGSFTAKKIGVFAALWFLIILLSGCADRNKVPKFSLEECHNICDWSLCREREKNNSTWQIRQAHWSGCTNACIWANSLNHEPEKIRKDVKNNNQNKTNHFSLILYS